MPAVFHSNFWPLFRIFKITPLFNMFQKLFKFIGEVKAELRKASWPWESDPKIRGFKKYKELIDSTVVVLIAIILMAGYVALWDLIHTQAVGFLGGLAK
jgi:preprotein translocase subunit SecE